MGKLTAAKVRAITRTGLHGDGDTLYLSVAPGGTKSWIQRLTVNGRCRDIGLGGFPLVSLAEARDKAFENRRCARAGGDPLAEKRKVAIPTFRQAAEQTFEANKPRWRNAQHTISWGGKRLNATPCRVSATCGLTGSGVKTCSATRGVLGQDWEGGSQGPPDRIQEGGDGSQVSALSAGEGGLLAAPSHELGAEVRAVR